MNSKSVTLGHGKANGISPLIISVVSAVFLLVCSNMSLWHGIWCAIAPGLAGVFELIVLASALLLLFVALIYLLLWPKIGKPLLMLLFLIAALVAYSIDAYGTHIDANMAENLFQTNTRELAGLLSWQLVGYVVLLGILPCLLLSRVTIRYPRWYHHLWLKPLVCVLCIGLSATVLYSDFQQVSSFGRDHRPLRYLINPWMPLYYGYSAATKNATTTSMPFKVIGEDAQITDPLAKANRPNLIFLVVGETARAQNFSLDGYHRPTNPELSTLNVFSFLHASSCGTETAVSVPCMFSPYPRTHYSRAKALHTSNVLDILKHAGISVLWRDNNSGSKGMADRVVYQDVSRSKDKADCAASREHCYDSVLLHGLSQWLKKHPGNQLVVLHMYGSHGPAYFKRYPREFAYFTPECKSNAFGHCSHQSIINSYDNTIRYTDHVLASMIRFLKQQKNYNTAMLYLSDHGESLGENGIYLHGMPRSIAPIEQTHIPFIWWMSPHYANTQHISASCLRQHLDQPVSQDDLFSSLLGMFDVTTQVYHQKLDFLAPCRTAKTSAKKASS